MAVRTRCALAVLLVISIASRTVTSLQLFEGGVRLRGAVNTALQGRVEVFHDGVWLSVCDSSWDSRKGDVVCRQLGFSGGAMSTDRSALFGQGTSISWLTGITCLGNEKSLSECTGLTYGRGTCSHATDVGVRCTYPMYQGCYTSSVTGPLTDYVSQSDTMHITRCLEICRGVSGGYTYAGVRQGRSCTCGNSISGAAKQGNSGCNDVCAGDETEICGGSATSSIYRTDNYYYDATNGGYVTSPKFPKLYTNADAFDRTVAIPSTFSYAVVAFAYFKLAAGDSVQLRASGSPTGNYGGGSSGTVPNFWISKTAATSFQVSFTVASTSRGDTGFALEYEFGTLCYPNTLPSAVDQGTFTASSAIYYYTDKVIVFCVAGYQRDRDAFVCQLDGTWSEAPVCSLIPTQPPPTTTTRPPTSRPATTRAADTTTPPGQVTVPGMSSRSTAPPSVTTVPCAVPQVADGTVSSQDRTMVPEGDSITVTCDDNFKPADGNNTARCLANGEFDVNLVCSPSGGLPIWLISIIVVAAVLATIVIVLIILLMLVSSKPKHPERRARPYPDEDYRNHEQAADGHLVVISPSIQQNPSDANSIASGAEDGGTVNQGAQTDADPALGELGDPMVGENDVYHPTRDYPGAGRPVIGPQRRPSPRSPPPAAVQLPRQRPVDYRSSTADFSMLANEELLAVRALDNVVSDFERGDQAYFLGPSGPSPYNVDRGSRYGSRQVQFSQRSRVGSFYGLY